MSLRLFIDMPSPLQLTFVHSTRDARQLSPSLSFILFLYRSISYGYEFTECLS